MTLFLKINIVITDKDSGDSVLFCSFCCQDFKLSVLIRGMHKLGECPDYIMSRLQECPYYRGFFFPSSSEKCLLSFPVGGAVFNREDDADVHESPDQGSVGADLH